MSPDLGFKAVNDGFNPGAEKEGDKNAVLNRGSEASEQR